jgi:hypothetical protein
MNIVIPLVEFLELETYNQLLPWVDLPINICTIIKFHEQLMFEQMAENGMLPTYIPCYHIEPLNHEVSRVWYPMSSWIQELKRREVYNNTLSDVEKQVTHDRKVVELRRQLIEATALDKTDEMVELIAKIKQLEKEQPNG